LRAPARVGHLLLLLGAALAPPAHAQEKAHALLVGINEYEHASLPPLRYAENDVEALARLLDRPGSPYHKRVRALTTRPGRKDQADQPTAHNVRKALADVLKGRTRKDNVLLAMTGHGVQLVVGAPAEKEPDRAYGYFCPSDTQLTPPSYKTGRHE